jgi:sulfate permease, SulP family
MVGPPMTDLARPPRPLASLAVPAGSTPVRQVLAGVTLAALCLPLNIGYAEAAGLPAIVGINASIIPLLLFAFTSGSRHLVTGPDATIAALLAAVLPGVAAESGADPEELALAVAVLTGAILLVLWAARAGAFVRFISKSVMVGFLAGLGIEILTSQIEKILAIRVETGRWLTDVVEIVRQVPEASGASVAVGVSTVVIVRLVRRFAPVLPGPLVALVLVGGAVAVLEPEGVRVLGDIPSGLPGLSFPTVGMGAWVDLAGTALAIAVLTIAEGLLLAGAAARRHEERFDANAELFPLGLANIGAAVTSGMPVGASASRTAALESAGMRCQVPAATAAVVIAVVALFLTDLVAEIPSAALAGLVANAVVSIIEVRELRTFARVRRTELVLALGCTAGVLALGPIGGLVLATLASAVDMVRRVASAPWALLGPPDGAWDRSRFRAEQGAGQARLPEGVVFIRPAGPLFFANADVLRERVADAASRPGVHWVVLDLESVSDIDPTAADALRELVELAARSGTTLALTRTTAPVGELLDRYGILDSLDGHRFQSNREALSAYGERHRSPGSDDAAV